MINFQAHTNINWHLDLTPDIFKSSKMDEICVIQNFLKTDDSSNYSLGQWVQWQRIWQQKLVLLDAEHAIETGFLLN